MTTFPNMDTSNAPLEDYSTPSFFSSLSLSLPLSPPLSLSLSIFLVFLAFVSPGSFPSAVLFLDSLESIRRFARRVPSPNHDRPMRDPATRTPPPLPPNRRGVPKTGHL